MKMSLEITSAVDQSKRRVVATFPDFIAFEAKFDRSITKINDGKVLSDLAWLAWHVEHRNSVTSLDFGAWCDEIESLDSSDEDNSILP